MGVYMMIRVGKSLGVIFVASGLLFTNCFGMKQRDDKATQYMDKDCRIRVFGVNKVESDKNNMIQTLVNDYLNDNLDTTCYHNHLVYLHKKIQTPLEKISLDERIAGLQECYCKHFLSDFDFYVISNRFDDESTAAFFRQDLHDAVDLFLDQIGCKEVFFNADGEQIVFKEKMRSDLHKGIDLLAAKSQVNDTPVFSKKYFGFDTCISTK